MYKHVVLMISQNNTFLLATASIWKSAIQTNKKYRCKTKILKIKYDFDFIQRLYFAMRSLSIDERKKLEVSLCTKRVMECENVKQSLPMSI